jgi:hypothetical protein
LNRCRHCLEEIVHKGVWTHKVTSGSSLSQFCERQDALAFMLVAHPVTDQDVQEAVAELLVMASR